MKVYVKQFLLRGLIGMLIGLSIGYTVLLGYSYFGNNLSITSSVLQFNYFIGLGVGFWMSAASIVYDIEEWSLLRQTVTHGILILPYIPVAFVIGWAPTGVVGRILFILMYIIVYIIIWFSFKTYWTKKADELNEGLDKLNKISHK